MLSLQKLIKRNGLVIKATGNVKFFFERLETTDVAKKIEEMLNDV